MPVLASRFATFSFGKCGWQLLYGFLAWRFCTPDWLFMNYGYADRGGKTDDLALEPGAEPHRAFIRMYAHILSQAGPVAGLDVLEVGLRARRRERLDRAHAGRAVGDRGRSVEPRDRAVQASAVRPEPHVSAGRRGKAAVPRFLLRRGAERGVLPPLSVAADFLQRGRAGAAAGRVVLRRDVLGPAGPGAVRPGASRHLAGVAAYR